MTIDPQISKYIDIAAERFDQKIDAAIRRERTIFNDDMNHAIGLTLEKFQFDLQLMGELVESKINEALDKKVPLYLEPIEKKLNGFASQLHRQDVRIKRLESKAA